MLCLLFFLVPLLNRARLLLLPLPPSSSLSSFSGLLVGHRLVRRAAILFSQERERERERTRALFLVVLENPPLLFPGLGSSRPRADRDARTRCDLFLRAREKYRDERPSPPKWQSMRARDRVVDNSRRHSSRRDYSRLESRSSARKEKDRCEKGKSIDRTDPRS